MDSRLFESLEWRNIGPHRGGRVSAVAGHPTEKATFFFGGCAGGVWKTTSGGAYWKNVSDGFFNTSAIGAIAVSDSDPNVVYAGTGESNIRSNVSHGDGVYKSTDGGATWKNVGLAETRYISDIQIHPKDSDVVFVGALGHAWGENEERGVYRTRDGGATWEKVLYKSARAGVADLSMDFNNPRVIYATIWQGQRYPHALNSGGEDSGLWRSLDGGDSWEELTGNKGLPEGIWGRCGVSASPAKPGRVWGLIEAEEGGSGLYRSEDYGATWEKLSDERGLRGRPWYYMRVFADPSDPDTCWVLNTGCFRSIDGGKTFTSIPTQHGDNHDLWIDPRDSNRMIEGNDGGAMVSFDGARTWSSILNQPTAQFYHVAVDDNVPYRLYGSQQDNWAMRLPSADFDGAISWKDYVQPGGGESGYIAISSKSPYRVFGGGIGTGAGHGRLLSWNPDTGHSRNVTVWPELHGMGAGADVMRYRFQWTFPVEISPHNPDVLYITSNHVHKSTNEGQSWETISPDLTRNDPEKIKSSGGPLTADNSGAEIYCTIFAFRESPHEEGVFWAGSDDGLVHISRDGGKSWNNVTPPQMPDWAQVNMIEVSPHDKATAYVVAMMYKHDDYSPYIFKTNDYGETWTSITKGIPADQFARVVREDPNRQGLLYAGTEVGLQVSFDDGANWQPFQCNLPVTPVYDVIVKDNDLLAATHGRAFWILDDLTPLYQLSDEIAGKSAHLFQPRPTKRFRFGGWPASNDGEYKGYKMTGPVTVAYEAKMTPQGTISEEFLDAGKNPPNGVIVHYYLREKPEGEVTLRFLDESGNELVSYTNDEEKTPHVPVAAGGNRFVWSMRTKSPTPLKDADLSNRFERMMEAGIAPKVVPGNYAVELTVNGETQRQTFVIEPDPRVPASAEDLRRQYEMKSQLRDRVSEVNESLNQIRKIKAQVESWVARAEGSENEEKVKEAAKSFTDKLTEVEGQLTNLESNKQQPGTNQIREKLAGLSGMIDESDDQPTQGAQELNVDLANQLKEQRSRLNEMVDKDLIAFENALTELKVPLVAE